MADEVIDQPTAVETPAAAPAAEVTSAPAAATPAAEPAKSADPEQKLRDAVGRTLVKNMPTEPAKPAAAETAKPAAEVKPGEQKIEEPAKPVAEPAKPAAEVVPPNPLDAGGPLPVTALAKAITDNPALATELEKAGLDPELLYETSRQAALAEQFIEAGLPTPEAAKFAVESAEHFYDIEEAFPKIQNVQDFDGFVINTMLPLSYLRDPATGEPLKNADGTFQTDGSVARFMDVAVQFDTIGAVGVLDQLIAQAAKIPGEAGENQKAEAERIKEAVLLVQSFRDNNGRLPSQKPAATQMSDADKAEMARLRGENEKTAQLRAEATQKENDAFHASVLTDAMPAIKGFVEGILNNCSGLTDNDKRNIAKEVLEFGGEQLGRNRHYQMQKENLYQQGNKPEVKQRLVNLAKTIFETLSKKKLESLITEYGGKRVAASKAKITKIDNQAVNDRHNQGTGTAPAAKPAAVLTGSEARNQAIQNLKAKGILYPDDGEILAETVSIRGMRQKTA